MEPEKIVNRDWRGEAQRDTKQWLRVLDLRAKDLTFAQIAMLTGVSRQRAHQIISQARHYASTHDDELARKITDLLKEDE